MTQVLLVNTYDRLTGGGAARAAQRLHQGLLHHGIDTSLLVQDQQLIDPTVISVFNQPDPKRHQIRLRLDGLPLTLYRRRQRPDRFSLQWLSDPVSPHIRELNPAVINLHWICHGFVPIEALARLNKPIVWTFHDMWAFTGGCYYDDACDRYKGSCGRCPQLGSRQEWDLSRWVWARKAKVWRSLRFTVVTPSQWLADCARSSPLLQHCPIQVIPNGLDATVFRPSDRQAARQQLNLPLDRRLLLFGALNSTSNPRKGFQLLQPALKRLGQTEQAANWDLVILGATQPSQPVDLGLKAHYLGTLTQDEALARVYTAADVFIAPSRQENLPNSVMEALACGTPCVAFDIGGMPDLIDHQQTGYLARPFAIDDLAQGIAWVLSDARRWQQLSLQARASVEQRFTQELQARRYWALFQTLNPVLSAPKG